MMITALLWLAGVASQPHDLDAQIEEIGRAARGRVGAAVLLLETGESVAWRGEERFPMQSVYKLPIAMAVLQQVDRGARTLEEQIRVDERDLVPAPIHSPFRDKHPRGSDVSVLDLLRLAIVESDGTASDVLLRLAGGPGSVTAYVAGLGVSDMVVATSEREMASGEEVQYRNYASPEAAVALLRALHEGRGLSPQSRSLLLRLMTETGTGPRRIKGLLPSEAVVAHKTGTSGTVGGLTRATNDVGLVTLPNGRTMAVAVFVSDSPADAAGREGVIARIARAAWDRWGAPSR